MLRNSPRPEFLQTDKAVKDIQDIYAMGMRISTIVSQLLAYSRRSDHLQEIRLDQVMNDAVALLERCVGVPAPQPQVDGLGGCSDERV